MKESQIVVKETENKMLHGETFDPKLDMKRLTKQRNKVFSVMHDGAWRSLAEIAHATGAPEASVSARLRDFRKGPYGGHLVERCRSENPERGVFLYRLVLNKDIEEGLFAGLAA